MTEEYKKVYRDVFLFHEKWNPKTENDWRHCAAEAKEIAMRHGNAPFVSEMISAAYADIARNCTNQKGVR